jgi:predicted house-cleaning noncanonical NTP pyrophosphatase (MazG superfamily)
MEEAIKLLDDVCEVLTNSELDEIATENLIESISNIQNFLNYQLGIGE